MDSWNLVEPQVEDFVSGFSVPNISILADKMPNLASKMPCATGLMSCAAGIMGRPDESRNRKLVVRRTFIDDVVEGDDEASAAEDNGRSKSVPCFRRMPGGRTESGIDTTSQIIELAPWSFGPPRAPNTPRAATANRPIASDPDSETASFSDCNSPPGVSDGTPMSGEWDQPLAASASLELAHHQALPCLPNASWTAPCYLPPALYFSPGGQPMPFVDPPWGAVDAQQEYEQGFLAAIADRKRQQFAVPVPAPDTAVQLTSRAWSEAQRVQDVGSALFASMSTLLHTFQVHKLKRSQCANTGVSCIRWTVDGKKLRGNDRSAVSPQFELSGEWLAAPLPFKLVVTPKVSNDGRAGGSFRVANGHGTIQLKCEASQQSLASTPMTFWLSAGNGRGLGAFQTPRGPVAHNLAQSGVCGLAKGQEIWDFNSLLDKQTQTFMVCLMVEGPWH